MLPDFKGFLQNPQLKIKTLAVVGACCFAVGLAVPFGMQWLKPAPPASAEILPAPMPATSTTDPSTPVSFADIAKKLSPSVVNIKVVKKVENVDFTNPDIPEGPFHDFFEKFFQGMPQAPRIPKRVGSGVIISKDGYVLTNNHVVEGAKEVIITLADQKEYKGRIIGTDRQTDVAVVKIDAQEWFPASTLGNSDALKRGLGRGHRQSLRPGPHRHRRHS